MTRSLFAAVMMTILLPAVAEAQAVEGYFVGGIAGWSHRYVGDLFGAAAGGDFNVTRFTAVEVEASLHLGNGSLLPGVSAGGRVRFRRRSGHRRVPFVTAGVTRVMSVLEAGPRGWHVGGGMEFGVDERRCVRVELRDVIPTESGSHFWSVRIGVAFQ